MPLRGLASSSAMPTEKLVDPDDWLALEGGTELLYYAP